MEKYEFFYLTEFLKSVPVNTNLEDGKIKRLGLLIKGTLFFLH